MMKETTLQVTEIQFPNAQLLPEIIKLLNEGHTVTLQLRGFSMRPFLEDNRDKALLTKAKDIKVGDAVLAEISYRHYVLHRIINSIIFALRSAMSSVTINSVSPSY